LHSGGPPDTFWHGSMKSIAHSSMKPAEESISNMSTHSVNRKTLFLFAVTVPLLFAAMPVISYGTENAARALARITQLKPLYLETSLGKPEKARASIVAGDEHLVLAEDLREQIEEVSGIRLPILTDGTALEHLNGHGNLIALGQYGNNKVLEKLYYRGYLVVDGIQPGKGGYVLETVHNPDNLGINVIVVGGSDSAGVEKAAMRLVENLKECGAVLPRLFEVEPGAGREIVERRGIDALDSKRIWPTNQMNVQEALGEAAMLYVYTGEEKYVVLFKTKLMEWLQEQAKPDHGCLDDFYRVIFSWDQVEESPVFSDEERLHITNLLWDELNLLRPKAESYVFSRKDKVQPRKNHGARSALSVYFAARYFWQY